MISRYRLRSALRMDEVGRDPGPPQRFVVGAHRLEIGKIVHRVGVQFAGPPGLAVPQQRDLGRHGVALNLLQGAQLGAEGADLAPDLGVGPGVRQHAGVELLRSGGGGTPLEEQHRPLPRATCVRPLRRSWPGVLARLRGCQFTALVECSISSQGMPPAIERVRSAVMVRAPGPVVQRLEPGQHEIGGDRHARRDPVQHVPFRAETVQQLIGGEPPEVQLLGRVDEVRRHP